MRDPLLDQLRDCRCPVCRAALRERARYFVYEANERWPHVITARCDACGADRRFRLKPVGHHYECLYVEPLAPSSARTGCTMPSYRDYVYDTWQVEGYGWVGEIRSGGSTLMPLWMQPDRPFPTEEELIGWIRAKIDDLLQPTTRIR